MSMHRTLAVLLALLPVVPAPGALDDTDRPATPAEPDQAPAKEYLQDPQDYFRAGEADQLSREAAQLLERVAGEYAAGTSDVNGNLVERARKELMRQLDVGKRAPAIEGEDIDGKRFKLSDYRGKVVLLDFWGNW
jgi:hypothetical protein